MTNHRLSRSDELALIRRYQCGDNAAGAALIRAHEPFLRGKVRLVCGDPEDAMQEARLGLLDAATRFDESRNVRLLTLAGYWIWHRLERFEWKTTGDVRLPYNRYSKGEKNFSARRIDAPLRTAQGDFGDIEFGDTLAVDAMPVDDEVDERRRQRLIQLAYRRAMATLLPRERLIVSERLCWDQRDQRTLQDLGNRLGVSRERVRQIEQRAKGKLREALVKFGAERLVAA